MRVINGIYKQLESIGHGTFGTVYKAAELSGQKFVAIKEIKAKTRNANQKLQLREVEILKRVGSHENIINLIDFFQWRGYLYFVFEYMEGNLLQLMEGDPRYRLKNNAKRSKSTIALTFHIVMDTIHQLLLGIEFIHSRKVLHRDLKPENILIRTLNPQSSSEPKIRIKIADFGLARRSDLSPPYTEYISTRWYRAPEILLHSAYYKDSMDIWAFGCIVFELFMLKPLFNGSTDLEQLSKICYVLGNPKLPTLGQNVEIPKGNMMLSGMNSVKDELRVWEWGCARAQSLRFHFPATDRSSWFDLTKDSAFIKDITAAEQEEIIKILDITIIWDPEKRYSAGKLLQLCFSQKVEKMVKTAPLTSSKPQFSISKGKSSSMVSSGTFIRLHRPSAKNQHFNGNFKNAHPFTHFGPVNFTSKSINDEAMRDVSLEGDYNPRQISANRPKSEIYVENIKTDNSSSIYDADVDWLLGDSATDSLYFMQP